MTRAIVGIAVAIASIVAAPNAAHAQSKPSWTAQARAKMVELQLEKRGIRNTRVLEAMRTVERHRFVPVAWQRDAYEDHPLPIGHDQTISQPYIVAAMTELIDPQPTDVVLEIGAGSGYQAAILSKLVAHVYTIEIVAPLAERAKKDLAELGFHNVTVITGDGYRGLPGKAPFDKIIVTAAPPKVPQPLLDQLKVGGRLVIPVGDAHQELEVHVKTDKGVVKKSIFAVRFVPMTGEAQKKELRR